MADVKSVFKTLQEQLVLEIRDENNPFKTGSKGFYAGGKVTIDGKRYQTSLSIVEIGSKPKA